MVMKKLSLSLVSAVVMAAVSTSVDASVVQTASYTFDNAISLTKMDDIIITEMLLFFLGHFLMITQFRF
jgi:hypothetical protein